MKLHQVFYPLILTLSFSAKVAASNLVFHEGKNEKLCQDIWSNALSGSSDLYEAIKLAGGIANYTEWLPLKGKTKEQGYDLEYSMLDFDNNGTIEPVVKGFIGCTGYQPFYRVLQNESVDKSGNTTLEIKDVWEKPGVGWCFNAQYEHYGIPNAFDLSSFQYKGTLYLTLKSYEFGRAEDKEASFVIAKYTGVINKPMPKNKSDLPTDKLELVCRFSYSTEVNQALKAQPSAAGTPQSGAP